MRQADIEELRAMAVRDSRTWRRLREIEARGHLANVTIRDVRKYATEVGLDPDKIVAGDKLLFDVSQRFSFLHLLNEDLYNGHLSGELFESQRKAPAGP
jgi:hypothetical protein